MSSVKTAKGTELPLLSVQGKPYLQVPWRVLWFCEEKPDWSIETEVISHTQESSLVRASVKNPEGRVLRTAYKQEDKTGFKDHLEKAESGAIGRALGFLGYGTQFALELDEGERLADSPIQQPNTPVKNYAPQAKHIGGDPFTGISESQVKRFWAMAKALKWSNEDALTKVKQESGKDKPDLLTKEEYTLLTTKMQVEIDRQKPLK